MNTAKLMTATIVFGLLAAPLLEADQPHTHTECDLQLLDAFSLNYLAPSITGQHLYRSDEELRLLGQANAAMGRWWSDFISGANKQ